MKQACPWAASCRAAAEPNALGAQVFKAVRGGQVVAVKIFHEHNRRGAPGSPAAQRCMAQGRDDLRREISLLRSLHDRNIVNFVGAAIWVSRGGCLAGVCIVWQPSPGAASVLPVEASGTAAGACDLCLCHAMF